MPRVPLLVLVGAAAAHASPVPPPGATLTPAQVKIGCTVDLIPWRPECHVAINGTSTAHVGATPSPRPIWDVGCGWDDGAVLPKDCHLGSLTIPNPIHDLVEMLRPSGRPHKHHRPSDGPSPTEAPAHRPTTTQDHSHTTTTTADIPTGTTTATPTSTVTPAPTEMTRHGDHKTETSTHHTTETHEQTTTTMAAPTPTTSHVENPTPTSTTPPGATPTTRHAGNPTSTSTTPPNATPTTSHVPSPTSTSTTPPSATPTDDANKNVTDAIKALDQTEKQNRDLKLGLGLGLGLGIPGAAVLGWVGHALTLAKGAPEINNALSMTLPNIGINEAPELSGSYEYSDLSDGNYYEDYYDEDAYDDSYEYPDGGDPAGDFPDDVTEPPNGRIEEWLKELETEDFRPEQGVRDLGSEVSNSVDELYSALREQGYNSEEAEQLINELQADLAASESSASATSSASSVVQGAVNAAGGGVPSTMDAAGVRVAANVASSGASPEAIADALTLAGVPAGDVASTTEAVTAAVDALPAAGPSNAAFDAALGVISKAVTPQSVALSEAASAAWGGAGGVGGVHGEGFASALRRLGVSSDALGSTVESVDGAIQAAKGSGITGLKLHTAVVDAITHALFSPESGATSSGGIPAPGEAVTRALTNVIGSSFNFWHLFSGSLHHTLKSLEGKSHSSALKKILANGPPPKMPHYRDITFPYLHRSTHGHGGRPSHGEHGDDHHGKKPSDGKHHDDDHDKKKSDGKHHDDDHKKPSDGKHGDDHEKKPSHGKHHDDDSKKPSGGKHGDDHDKKPSHGKHHDDDQDKKKSDGKHHDDDHKKPSHGKHDDDHNEKSSHGKDDDGHGKPTGTSPSQPATTTPSPGTKNGGQGEATGTHPSQPTSNSPSPTVQGPDKPTGTSSSTPPEPTVKGFCNRLTGEEMAESAHKNGKAVSDGLSSFKKGGNKDAYLASLRQDPAEAARLLEAVPIAICSMHKDPGSVKMTPPGAMGPEETLKMLLSMWDELLKIKPGQDGSTTPSAPPAPTARPALRREGLCANVTDEGMEAARTAEVDEDLYGYGGVNMTLLKEYAEHRPHDFNEKLTTSVPLARCAVQIMQESPAASDQDRVRFQFVAEFLAEYLSAMAEVNATGHGIKPGSGPAPPGTGGYLYEAPDYLMRVPRLRLPLGPVCRYFDNIPEWLQMLRQDESKIRGLNEYNSLLFKSAYLFDHHRELYVLYMRVHPEEIASALEFLDDAQCTLGKELKSGLMLSTPGYPTGEELLATIRAMAKAIREIKGI